MYQYYNSGAKTKSKKLVDSEYNLLGHNFFVFGFIIKVTFKLKCSVINGISIDVINRQMYTKGYSSFYFGLGGSLALDFIVVSFGGQITGSIGEGDTYIQANSILNSDMTKFWYYRELTTCSVDLKLFFSVWILFWKKEFSKTFNLYGGLSSYDNFYKYY